MVIAERYKCLVCSELIGDVHETHSEDWPVVIAAVREHLEANPTHEIGRRLVFVDAT